MKVIRTPEEVTVKLTPREAEMLRSLAGGIGANILERMQERGDFGYGILGKLTYGDEGEYDVNDLLAGLWGFLR
jgi:hypothetical protein